MMTLPLDLELKEANALCGITVRWSWGKGGGGRGGRMILSENIAEKIA